MSHLVVVRPHVTAAEDTGAGMAGPVATLQITSGVLLVLAGVLALVAGDPAIVLTALGVTGLVPVTLGALVRASRRPDREEDAAIVMPVGAVFWQPVVLITGLRELIFQVGPMGLAAGIATVALAVYCSLPARGS